jgi:phospholipid N-methyltransferase
MAEPHFFQAFFGPQPGQIEQQIPEYIINNETVLEIINNWEFVQDLMKRHREGKLQNVDQWEHLWYNYIIVNKIDITFFKNKEDFYNAFWKVPQM